MSTPQTAWRKSSFSSETECVELAPHAVRDSKNLPGPTLRFDPTHLAEFIAGTKDGTFDLPR